MAHEEGNLNNLRAILGNDVAIKAYREGKLPFPDGTIIARLAWSYIPSEENNKVFGRSQSFVAGSAHERSVHGQGLKKIRRHRRLGIRSIQRRQTWRRERCSKPASPATSLSKLATLSSPVTHLNSENDNLARGVKLNSTRNFHRRIYGNAESSGKTGSSTT